MSTIVASADGRAHLETIVLSMHFMHLLQNDDSVRTCGIQQAVLNLILVRVCGPGRHAIFVCST